ncbi:hypothetical protein C8F04DRAFT_1119233, partial [Mycena alexandri]
MGYGQTDALRPTSCNVFSLLYLPPSASRTSIRLLRRLKSTPTMEAVAFKIAGDVAAPVGTHIYETLKKQTGRAKFEKGKSTLNDGFAILCDEKAGGLLAPQERLKLLETHAQLVAVREGVDEITNTVYGSLAHRNTAKEFSSKAQKFRKNVETPTERAQMEYELRKAECEMAAGSKPIPKTSIDSEIPEQPVAEKRSSSTNSTGELTRKPTPLYPSSSGSRLAPVRSPQTQRTHSLPNPKTTSASYIHAADSAGEVKPALRRQRHILISSVETYTGRRTPMANSKSSLESQGPPCYISEATRTSDASEKRHHAASGAQRFQTAAPPLFNENSENVPLPPAVVPPEPSELSQHRLRHSRSRIALDGASPRRPHPLLPSVSEQDLESRYRSAHIANNSQATQSQQSMAAGSGAARNLTQVLASLPSSWEESRDPTQWAETSETWLHSDDNQNFAHGELFNPPMYWNILPPDENPPGYTPGDAHSVDGCPCQKPYPSAYQGRPCSNCRNRELVQPFVPSTQPTFPHPHLSHSQMPNHHTQPNFSQYNTCNSDDWGNRPQYPGSHNDRGHATQIEVRVQYPPIDYLRTTSYN